MTDNRDDRTDLEAILVDLTERALDGERIDPSEVVAAHPGLAEGLGRALPRILALVEAFDGEEPPAFSTSHRAPNGYRTTGPLRSGGQGHVVEVEEARTGRRAAFKVLTHGDQEAFREALAFDRLRNEDHPAIVRVLEVSSSGILMELLTGPDLGDLVDPEDRPGAAAVLRLAEHLKGPRPPYAKVALAFAELARGIAALHEKGILHRDLKPQNIKVEPGRGLVLFDLGLARIERLETISDPGTVLGTVPYLAPEALPGEERSFDERTDVYGVGATLYSVLTNRLPHAGDDVLACLVSVRSRRPQPVSSFNPAAPEGLAQIVRMAMERRPDDRYGSVLELAQDLERFAAGRSALAEIGREARIRRRRWIRAGVVATLVLVVLLVVVVSRVVETAGEREREEEEAARVARMRKALASSRAHRGAGRALLAEAVAREALDLAADSREELAAIVEQAEALNAMGRTREATALLSRLMDGGKTSAIRLRAREALARVQADAGEFGAVYRLLVDRERELSPRGQRRLLDAMLSLGRRTQARQLLEAIGDVDGRAVLDRFELVRRLPLDGVKAAVAVDDGRGGSELAVVTKSGELCRFVDGAEEPFRSVPYDGSMIESSWLHATGRPREVVICGRGGPESGAVAVVDILTGETRRWDGGPFQSRVLFLDVDGDGSRERLSCYQVDRRGVEIRGEGDDLLELGDLEELNGANSDVRAVVPRRDPRTGALTLIVGLGPWNQSGLGYGVVSYRWRGEGGFERVGRRRVGELYHLSEADLDGDGVDELYGSVGFNPTRDQGLIYQDFLPPGIYRIDPDTLEFRPLGELKPRPAFFGRTGELVPIRPEWTMGWLQRVENADGRDSLVAYSSILRKDGSRRTYLEVRSPCATGVRGLPLPTHHLVECYLAAGDVLADHPGSELVSAGAGEVLVFGRTSEAARGAAPRDVRVSLVDDPGHDEFPPPGWTIRDRRSFRIREDGGIRLVFTHGRDDRLLRPVRLRAGGFRFRARLTIREEDWAGSLVVGLLPPAADVEDKEPVLALRFSRSSYGPRSLALRFRGENGRLVTHDIEPRGSFGLRWDTPLDLAVEFLPEPPSLLISCRNVRTGELLHAFEQRIADELPEGSYHFGIQGQDLPSPYRATTWADLYALELVLYGEGSILPPVAEAARTGGLEAVERAHRALLRGDGETARTTLDDLRARGVDLAPLLIGPFAESGLPLALLALEVTEGQERARLRERLLALATARSWAVHDPGLAIGIFEATGYSDSERETVARMLRWLGRTREAYALAGSPEVLARSDAGDAAARLSGARGALNALRPFTAEDRISTILTDPPSLRAEIDALIIGAQAALMRGDEEVARRRIERLRSIPEFEEEELFDHRDLARFLGKSR